MLLTRQLRQLECKQRTLTQAAVAVVNHEVGAKGPGREVVHAAGTVRHIPHHDGVSLREPAQKTLISAGTRTAHGRTRLVVMVIDARSAPCAAHAG